MIKKKVNKIRRVSQREVGLRVTALDMAIRSSPNASRDSVRETAENYLKFLRGKEQ